MDLKLYEQFLLFSLDKIKGKFLVDSLALNYGLAGAILFQLSESEVIRFENKKLIYDFKKVTEDKILEDAIELFKKSKKLRSVKYWVNKLGSKSSFYKKQILNDLINRKIISIQKKKFLWIFTFTYYPIVDYTDMAQLKTKLVDIVLNFKKADLESVLLLSLIHSCKLTRILFPDKKDHKKANERLKVLTKDLEIGEAVSQTIKEIQAAVIIASTSAVVAATAASTSS